jgi:hypothetical protein
MIRKVLQGKLIHLLDIIKFMKFKTTNTIPILMHQMRILINEVSAVVKATQVSDVAHGPLVTIKIILKDIKLYKSVSMFF